MIDRTTLAGLAAQDFQTDRARTAQTTVQSGGPQFQEVLQTQLRSAPPLQFSQHAQRRLESRSIPFGTEETRQLEEAVEKAASKGARESLILMNDLALVVSIKNRTVITAVDADSRKENVFTNIDSVVLA